jgi:hypothetical protein
VVDDAFELLVLELAIVDITGEVAVPGWSIGTDELGPLETGTLSFLSDDDDDA